MMRLMQSGGMSALTVRVRRLLAPVARLVVGTPLEGPAYRVWNVVSRGSRPSGAVEYDELTLAVMRKVLRRDANGIDVGAHRGTILRHLVELAPQGRHFAVEPLPVFAAGLRRRFPQVQILELALADQPGVATFHHVVTNPSYSGLGYREYPHEGEVIDDITVKVERLDTVIPAELPIAFVKIDVEGGELGVVQGSRDLIAKWHPVMVFEHGWGQDGTEPAGLNSTGLWEELHASGMGVYELQAWLEGAPALTLTAFRERLGAGSYYFLAAEQGSPA
jgi:FkbM family methyltransferase